MIHALLDTNVVIDALLERPPWSSDAKPLWQAHREKRLVAYVTATTLTDIFYLSHRHAGLAKAWQSVHYLLNHLPIISVGIDELRSAATLEGHDFEDNLQIACATRMQLDAIVTRDSTGFSVVREAFDAGGWCNNSPLRNPTSTLSMSTFCDLILVMARRTE